MLMNTIFGWFFVLVGCNIAIVDASPFEFKLGVSYNTMFYDKHIDELGVQYKAAILMAIEELNDKSDGVYDDLLTDINLVFKVLEPETSSTEDGAVAAIEFNDWGARAVIGYQDDLQIMGGATLYDAFETLQIGYNADSPVLDPYSAFLRVNPPTSQQGYLLPLVAYNYYGWKRIAICKSYSYFGFQAAINYGISGDILGITASSKEYILYPTQNYTDIVQELIDEDYKIIWIASLLEEGAQLLYTAYEMGLLKKDVQIYVSAYGDEDFTMASSNLWLNKASKLHGLDKEVLAEILTGVQTFKYYVNRTRPEAVEFINRFRAQPSTYGNNQSTCSDAQDDDGRYLHNMTNVNGDWYCTGLDFSDFAEDGSDIADNAFHAYDSVMLFARTLNYLSYAAYWPYVYYSQYTNLTNLCQMILYTMNSVEFEGASGKVFFDEYPFRLSGERLGAAWEVISFNPDVFLDDSNIDLKDGYVTIGHVRSDTGYTPCDPVDPNCYEPIYNTHDGKPAHDVPVIRTQQMTAWMKTLLFIVAGLILFPTLVMGFFVFIFRQRKIVRILQPEFALPFLIGAICAAIFGIMQTQPISYTMCNTSMWLAHMAYSVTFCPLIAKTWRIANVLNNEFTKVKITVGMTYSVGMGLLAVVLIILIIKTVNQTMVVEDRTVTDNFSQHIVEKECVDHGFASMTILYVYESLIAIAGLYLCYRIRNVPSGVSDAAQVVRAIFSFVIAVIAILPILRFVQMTPSVAHFLIGLTIMICSCRIFVVMYWAAVWKSLQGFDLDRRFESVQLHDPWVVDFSKKNLWALFKESKVHEAANPNVRPRVDSMTSVQSVNITDEKQHIQIELERLQQRLAYISNKELFRDVVSHALHEGPPGAQEHDSNSRVIHLPSIQESTGGGAVQASHSESGDYTNQLAQIQQDAEPQQIKDDGNGELSEAKAKTYRLAASPNDQNGNKDHDHEMGIQNV